MKREKHGKDEIRKEVINDCVREGKRTAGDREEMKKKERRRNGCKQYIKID